MDTRYCLIPRALPSHARCPTPAVPWSWSLGNWHQRVYPRSVVMWRRDLLEMDANGHLHLALDIFFQWATRFIGARPIWKVWAPLRVKLYMWLAVHQPQCTTDRKHGWGLQDASMCVLCYQELEMADHLFCWPLRHTHKVLYVKGSRCCLEEEVNRQILKFYKLKHTVNTLPFLKKTTTRVKQPQTNLKIYFCNRYGTSLQNPCTQEKHTQVDWSGSMINC
jgi:hypothetical protein